MKNLSGLEVGDYLKISWRRRWYIVITAVLIISGAIVYAQLMPDIYKSETRIMVEDPLVSEDYVRPTVQDDPRDRINSIREQLASRTFLEQIIQQFQMYGYGEDPDFIMENAVKAARKQIGIDKTSDNTFTISFVSTDPNFAQNITRQLAQEMIRVNTRVKKDRVLATDQFIDDQLRQTAAELAKQGDLIKQFKMAHLGELPEQRTANMNFLTGLYSQLSGTENAIQQAQERKKLLDFKWQERERLNLLSQNLLTSDIVVGSDIKRANVRSQAEAELEKKKAQFEQYTAKYTPNHPDMVTLTRDIDRLEKQVRDEKSAVDSVVASGDVSAPGADPKPATAQLSEAGSDDPMKASFEYELNGIESEIDKREKEKREILQQIKIYQNRLGLAPKLEQELEGLQREEGVLRGRYETLQKQKFNTQMAATVENDNRSESYRIIDEANLPVKAEYPNRLQIVLLGIGGGLMCGFGAAIGRELLDSTIGSEEEAQRIFQLPVLATVSIVPKKSKPKGLIGQGIA